ncbi:hypothetical protein AVEN_162764-1 [Araneus ventricosus]|uniref:Uncharacterized protein n=1 Tax=Araneus ventricosus TaxID=182803 RepID=A0A4Y2T9P0_ARAVE|nr:hypothetical protein AVEN_162764-1 [Araneus ventricosus]
MTIVFLHFSPLLHGAPCLPADSPAQILLQLINDCEPVTLHLLSERAIMLCTCLPADSFPINFKVPNGSLPTLKKLKPFAYLEISIYVALQTETGPLFIGAEWKFGEWRDNSVVLVIWSTFKMMSAAAETKESPSLQQKKKKPNKLPPVEELFSLLSTLDIRMQLHGSREGGILHVLKRPNRCIQRLSA